MIEIPPCPGCSSPLCPDCNPDLIDDGDDDGDEGTAVRDLLAAAQHGDRRALDALTAIRARLTRTDIAA